MSDRAAGRLFGCAGLIMSVLSIPAHRPFVVIAAGAVLLAIGVLQMHRSSR